MTKLVNSFIQMSNDLLSSKFITIVLMVLVITLQFDKCHSDKENFDLIRSNVKSTTDSILTAFYFDKVYFDSAETVRRQLLTEVNNLVVEVKNNQNTMLINQEISKKNQKQIIELTKQIIDLANLMKKYSNKEINK